MKTYLFDGKDPEALLAKHNVGYVKKHMGKNLSMYEAFNESSIEELLNNEVLLPTGETIIYIGNDIVIRGKMAYVFTKRGDSIIKSVLDNGL
ncbi:MAG: hypothetical protein ACXQTP_06435 [Candidatus Methanofastidiosia archaeon]